MFMVKEFVMVGEKMEGLVDCGLLLGVCDVGVRVGENVKMGEMGVRD